MTPDRDRRAVGRRLGAFGLLVAIGVSGCAAGTEAVATDEPPATEAPATTEDGAVRMSDEEILAQARNMAEHHGDGPLASIEWVRADSDNEAMALLWPGLEIAPEEDMPVIFMKAEGEFVDKAPSPLHPDIEPARVRFYYAGFTEDGTVMSGALTYDDVDLSPLGEVTRWVAG